MSFACGTSCWPAMMISLIPVLLDLLRKEERLVAGVFAGYAGGGRRGHPRIPCFGRLNAVART